MNGQTDTDRLQHHVGILNQRTEDSLQVLALEEPLTEWKLQTPSVLLSVCPPDKTVRKLCGPLVVCNGQHVKVQGVTLFKAGPSELDLLFTPSHPQVGSILIFYEMFLEFSSGSV